VPVSIDDVIANGHMDWNDRINRAHASETAWRRVAACSLAVVAFSIAGNVYQGATKPGPVVVHVVHSAIGGVIAVSSNNGDQDGPSQVQLKAAVEGWVTNCRSIFVDINAMRRTLTGCAALIEKSSAADHEMASFYNTPHKEEPFVRAATETVTLLNVVAIPPTSADIGPQQQQTWGVQWVEKVSSRDGSSDIYRPWGANVTFIVKPPTNIAQAQLDPDGIHIISYSWTEK
jgi:type IV secretory pathway TrbF-like protein